MKGAVITQKGVIKTLCAFQKKAEYYFERRDTAGAVPGVSANACWVDRSRRPCGKDAPLSSLPQVGGFIEALLMRLGHHCDTLCEFCGDTEALPWPLCQKERGLWWSPQIPNK